MTEPLLKALIRKDVDVRLQNMVAVQMEKQNLKEKNLKDAKKCLSRLEVSTGTLSVVIYMIVKRVHTI
jgi:hypothetical protein